MIVVSDTSPLNYLVLLNAVDILPKLFKEVYAPPEVMAELQRSRTPERVKLWGRSPPGWLHVHAPTTTVAAAARLDRGEAQAIALAKELRAAAVLIDERKGRRVAKQEGLEAVGTITVLELAAQQSLIQLKPALEALQRIRISSNLIQGALERDAARNRR